MKVKIKVKKIGSDYLIPDLKVIDKGDWIDVYSQEDVKISNLGRAKLHKIKLGMAVELPKGYEAILVPRSSSPENFGFFAPNSFGVIDNVYNGNEDEWKLLVIAFKSGNIKKGDRIGQFRIQLSQKATFWQKLKWFFSSGIKIQYVESLNNKSRGGFGTTGKN